MPGQLPDGIPVDGVVVEGVVAVEGVVTVVDGVVAVDDEPAAIAYVAVPPAIAPAAPRAASATRVRFPPMCNSLSLVSSISEPPAAEGTL
jgi:hypothetical protein